MKNARSLLLTLLAILVIVIAFALLVDLDQVAGQLRRASPRDLALASAMLLAGLAAYALRWRTLLADKPSPSFTFHAGNIGHAVNLFIPLRLGEAARIAVMGGHDRVTVSEATSSFVLERLFEQVMRLTALLGAVAVGAGAAVSGRALAGGVLAVVGATAVFVWLVRARATVLQRWPPILARLPRVTEAGSRRALAGWLENVAAVATGGRLLQVLLWSAVSWAAFWGYHFFALRALALPLHPDQVQMATLLSLAAAPPSAPTQPGIYHLSVVAPLLLVGLAREPMTSYAVVMHALQILWMLPLGLWGLKRTGFSPRILLAESKEMKGQT